MALAALALVAGPIAVHLLTRRHARRVRFPAMRFVPAMPGAAVRVERPTDVMLLVLRAAAIAAAALAVAQPVWVTAARQRAWATRLTRAVVIDRSASVAAPAATAIADRDREGAFASRRFESADLREAIQSATAWLDGASGRRELVVVSDFQLGAVDAGDLTRVPPAIGVRLERAGPPSAAAAAGARVDGWRGGTWTPSTRLGSDGTEVTWRRESNAAEPSVEIRAPEAEMPLARRALDAAYSWGLTGLADRRIEIAFPGAAVVAAAAPHTAWIACAALALQGSALAASADPSLTIGERDGVMIARTSVPARSPLAPAVVRAVLAAAAPAVADREMEPRAMDDAALASMTGGRTAGPVAPGSIVPPEASDGRWLWAVALGLVLAEGALRGTRRKSRAQEIRADAA